MEGGVANENYTERERNYDWWFWKTALWGIFVTYSRVMCYLRPVTLDGYKTSEYNIGKYAEHKERVFYTETKVLQSIKESEAISEAV